MAVNELTLSNVYAFQVIQSRDLSDDVFVHATFNFASSRMISCSQDQSDFLTLYFQIWNLNGANNSPSELIEQQFDFPTATYCMGVSMNGLEAGMLVGLEDSVMYMGLVDFGMSPSAFYA